MDQIEVVADRLRSAGRSAVELGGHVAGTDAAGPTRDAGLGLPGGTVPDAAALLAQRWEQRVARLSREIEAYGLALDGAATTFGEQEESNRGNYEGSGS